MESVLVTGAAGFIGSRLCKELLKDKKKVIGIDNFLLGTKQNIKNITSINKDYFEFIEHDLSDESQISNLIEKLKKIGKIDEVWHMAANSDIRAYEDGFEKDFRNTFLTTVNTGRILESINTKKLIFASSSAIFGTVSSPIKEKHGPILPESYYGAMKVASEAYISSITTYFLNNYLIFRFPNVVGKNVTHGIVFDFIKKLKNNPEELKVLGNGSQKKPYLYIDDLIDGMKFISNKNYKNGIYNLTPLDDGITVKEIAEIAIEVLSPDSKPRYEDTPIGWSGDVPYYSYDSKKMLETGWKPKYSSRDAIKESFKKTNPEK